MHPVGPHSERTYWIRRAGITVVALLALIGLVFWLAGRGSGPDVDPAAADLPTTTPELTGVLSTTTPSTTSSWSFDNGAGLLADGTTGSTDTTTDDAAPGTTSTTDSDTTTSADDPGAETSGAGAVTSAGADGATATGSSSVPATPSTAAGAASVTGAASAATSPSVDAAATTGTASTATSPSAVAPATTTVTEAVTTTVTVTATVTSSVPPAPAYDAQGRLICPDTSISVTAIGWSDEFPVGSQPRIGMSVKNIGDDTCMRDISGALQVYTVYTADGDRVWSTNDCFPGTGHEVHRFAPGTKANFTIVWAGTTSTPGCDTERVTVKPGEYKLVAQLGELTGKPMMFTMVG